MNNNDKNHAGQAAEKRKQVQKEINLHKVNIDKTIFIKSIEEKERLKLEKSLYKQNNKK